MNSMTGAHVEDGRPMAIGEEGTAAGEGLSLDAVYHLLQNQRRRRIIRYLAETDGTATRDEIVGRLAKLEAETEGGHISSQARQRVYVALHQTHLPKLDRADIVEYAPDRGTVTPRSALEEIYRVLENTRRVSAVEDLSGSTSQDGSRNRSTDAGIVSGPSFGDLPESLRSSLIDERILLTALVAMLAIVWVTVLYHS